MPDFTTQLHSDILPEYHRTQESGAVQQCPTKQKSYLVKWICGIYGSPLLPCYITLKPPKLRVVDHPLRPVLMPPLPQSLDHNNNSSRFTTQRSPHPSPVAFGATFEAFPNIQTRQPRIYLSKIFLSLHNATKDSPKNSFYPQTGFQKRLSLPGLRHSVLLLSTSVSFSLPNTDFTQALIRMYCNWR